MEYLLTIINCISARKNSKSLQLVSQIETEAVTVINLDILYLILQYIHFG